MGGCSRLAASSMSTASGRRSRSSAPARSGCWRQSDGCGRISRSSGTRTRRMSTTARTGETNRAGGSVAHRSHMSRPRSRRGKSTRLTWTRRNVKTPRSYTQGYNAQAVVNEEQIVLAAEVTASSPDFGHLEPMVKATKRELQKVGVTETPGVAVADSGYWNEQQMDNVIAQRACPGADPARRRQARHAAARMGRRKVHIDAPGTRRRLRRRAIQKTKGDGRAGIRADQAQPPHQPVSATKQIRRTLGMAAGHRHPQPPEAPQTPDSRHSRLKGRPGGHGSARQHHNSPRNTRHRQGDRRHWPRHHHGRNPLRDTHRPERQH